MTGDGAQDAGAVEEAIRRGLDRLATAQLPSGEFASYATPLGVEEDWNSDSSVFVTSLCILALQRLRSSQATTMVDRARELLSREASYGPLWRFWTHDHDRHLEIPCDADDTACATMALDARSGDADRTRRLLLGNRDRAGRFHTWFIPRGVDALRPRLWRNTFDEWRAHSRRQLFWELTEAAPDDVDAVVNANVLRLFGPAAPTEAVAYVSDVVRSGRERDSDSWHRNEFSCWYAVADGVRRGVPYDSGIGSLVRARISERVEIGVADLTALDAAHALGSLVALGDGSATGRCGDGDVLAGHLLDIQSDEGGWPRSIFFYGGPKEVFAWGSEDLATAMSIASLQDYDDARTPG